jgi:hypothetical protein
VFMRRILLAAIAALIFATGPALADERALDGLLGGLAGAVVLGPVGLVAGAITGATAGPAISRSWGLDGQPSTPPRKRATATAKASH